MARYDLGYDYDELRQTMRHWLLGREYYLALEAMEFGLAHHTGTRKDGVTPEFFHQLFQAQMARSLTAYMIHPEETLATIFLHDVVEDCDVEQKTIFNRFGSLVDEAVRLMTNVEETGVKKDKAHYYPAMIPNAIASLVKGLDRCHNIVSMAGVFTVEKQESYIQETEDHVIPMLRAARKTHARQAEAYQMAMLFLRSNMHTIVKTREGSSPDTNPAFTAQ